MYPLQGLMLICAYNHLRSTTNAANNAGDKLPHSLPRTCGDVLKAQAYANPAIDDCGKPLGQTVGGYMQY